ncbi:5470_t:CDS:2 [Paraglomus brasilianum]|uniref:5470_t:CDS:1 n=1 Tax=Paraglomus brasilianum TaxID=144538 RepID=A0A9N8VCN8_9GLOM|nr:5470_t:CDS:2 [Paraglomus brasilianum]
MTKEGTLILAKPRSNSMEASQPINSVSKMQDDGNYDKGRYSIQKLDNARLSYRRFNDIDINEIRICADRDQPLNADGITLNQ